MSGPDHAPLLSIIMPCWQDSHEVEQRLAELDGWAGLGRDAEIIVSATDGDDASHAGIATHAGVRIVQGDKPNRGAQFIAGVQAAKGIAFLFQHADTPWTPAHLEALLMAVRADADLGGAFYRDTAAMYPRWARFEGLVRWWHRHGGTLLGDQSVFCSRSRYERIGGFKALALVEDLDFSRRLRRSGTITLLDPPIRHSLRRFANGGGFRLRLLNFTVLALARAGVSAETLHKLYYRKAK